MDYKYFESLDKETAEAFLNRFIELESQAVEAMQTDAIKTGIILDYSLESLPTILKWMGKGLRITRIPVPETEPEWIRQFHKDGLIEFDEESKITILRAAYYLGESFVQANNALHWAVGNIDYMEKNMPAVTGFKYDKEMAPMVVCENIFSNFIGDGAPETSIDEMIKTWITFIL